VEDETRRKRQRERGTAAGVDGCEARAAGMLVEVEWNRRGRRVVNKARSAFPRLVGCRD
jgi:hypothetical protein